MSTIDDAATCPACGATGLRIFHEEANVPSHSCLLLDDAEQARDFPTGQIRLGFCANCGFITNTAFDQSLSAYSSRYEETQGFSERFRVFASDLAKRWVDDYDLHGKTVFEIGCGKGEFLVQMVEHGAGAGIGIDPGVNPDRIDSTAADRLTWIADLYSQKYAHIQADAIVCRHTLEHISPVGDFLRLIRSTIGDRTDTVVLFELPDVLRVLRETAFWDVYYEHCSYFSIGSLVRLFRACGFDVVSARMEYDDQYIVLEARPTAQPSSAPVRIDGEDDLDALASAVDHFEASYAATIQQWRQRVADASGHGKRVVIWGGGSKGVAFVTALGGEAGVEYAVDINPFKADKYLAGGGQRVVAPEFLREYQPGVAIVMNPIYRDEIQADLDRLGVAAELWLA
jgi:cyclopropane fatty-acyl-phospholipid synthase-like methyltransferase